MTVGSMPAETPADCGWLAPSSSGSRRASAPARCLAETSTRPTPGCSAATDVWLDGRPLEGPRPGSGPGVARCRGIPARIWSVPSPRTGGRARPAADRNPARPMFTSPSRPVRVSASVRRVRSTKATRRRGGPRRSAGAPRTLRRPRLARTRRHAAARRGRVWPAAANLDGVWRPCSR